MERRLHRGPLPRALLVAAVLLAVRGGPALAGDYHERTTLNCGECHVMHPNRDDAAELAAVWTGDALPESSYSDALLERDVNDLCLSCHDGSPRANDVLDANRGRDPGAVRQAGFLNRLGLAGAPATGHTLDSTEPAPGSSPPWSPELEGDGGLTCIHCHAHHGSQGEPAYRNLRSDAGHNRLGDGLVTYNHASPGTLDATRDVFLRRALDADESALDFNEPDPTDSAMGRFCAGCHGEFHGAPGGEAVGGRPDGESFTAFRRHPTAGVDIGGRGAGGSSLARLTTRRARVKVMSPVGVWDPPPRGATPTCVTCHRAHGNRNPFGLIYRSGSGLPTEDGDTGGDCLEHLCGQCHGEASAFSTS